MSKIQDREDRMLAYYINLIKQQEEQKQTGEKRPYVRKNKEGVVKSTDEAEPEPLPERSEVERDVTPHEKVKNGILEAALSGPDSSTSKEATPRKPAKVLAQQEAERIISTILEKRPGRAEFSVPATSEKKKPLRPDDRRLKKADAVTEERITIDIEPVATQEKLQEQEQDKLAGPLPKKRGRSKNVAVETNLGETITVGTGPSSSSRQKHAASAQPIDSTKESTFTVTSDSNAEKRTIWWREPVALDLVPYEHELNHSIRQLAESYSDQLTELNPVTSIFSPRSVANRILLVFPFS